MNYKFMGILSSAVNDRVSGYGIGQTNDISVGDGFKYEYFNPTTLRLLNNYGVIKVGVAVLLIVLALLIIKNMWGIRSIFTSKAIRTEVDNYNSLRDRDDRILKANKFIRGITNLVTNSGLRVNPSYREYFQYNLDRANVRIPGGSRIFTPDEFNSLKLLCVCFSILGGLILAYFVSPFFGLILGFGGGVTINALPMMIIRRIVAEKDNEIREDFPDLYLMIHYEIMSGGNTPLAKAFNSYRRVANSVEMLKFVDTSINMFETYGDEEAATRIAKIYREIPEVTRLMRLINQLHSGGDVKKELNGFREQIIKDKKYRLEVKMNKLIIKAKMSFYLTYAILGQAIVSAMALFFPRMDFIKF